MEVEENAFRRGELHKRSMRRVLPDRRLQILGEYHHAVTTTMRLYIIGRGERPFSLPTGGATR